MPHIRYLYDGSIEEDMIYINGTLVQHESYMGIEALLKILESHLGFDAKSYIFESSEAERDVRYSDAPNGDLIVPQTLREWGERVNPEDRIGKQ